MNMSYFNPRAPYGARPSAPMSRQTPGHISIHAPHTGRDATYLGPTGVCHVFQSTRPIRGATRHVLAHQSNLQFQSTRPIRGATYDKSEIREQLSIFQSTRPIRGATPQARKASVTTCISIHAPHTGRDSTVTCLTRWCIISIHAPHTGRDYNFPERSAIFIDISIHAPHTGRDLCRCNDFRAAVLFQSTRPIRGATFIQFCGKGFVLVISIHAPHTGRDQLGDELTKQLICISIHAPHTGRDMGMCKSAAKQRLFQSTRPIRGATWKPAVLRLP